MGSARLRLPMRQTVCAHAPSGMHFDDVGRQARNSNNNRNIKMHRRTGLTCLSLACITLVLLSGCCLARPADPATEKPQATNWPAAEDAVEEAAVDTASHVRDEAELEVPAVAEDAVEKAANWAEEESVPVTAAPDTKLTEASINEPVVEEDETVDDITEEDPLGPVKDLLQASVHLPANFNLDEIDQENIIFVQEKDGDQHIHIRLPAKEGEEGVEIDQDIPGVNELDDEEELTDEDYGPLPGDSATGDEAGKPAANWEQGNDQVEPESNPEVEAEPEVGGEPNNWGANGEDAPTAAPESQPEDDVLSSTVVATNWSEEDEKSEEPASPEPESAEPTGVPASDWAG